MNSCRWYLIESFQEKAMNNFRSNRRTDDQLEAILYETSDWTVNGQGQLLCRAASLQQAIDSSDEFCASGAVVIAICRLPADNIIIFSEQIARLRRRIKARELCPAKV
jgi:hypothetical protein